MALCEGSDREACHDNSLLQFRFESIRIQTRNELERSGSTSEREGPRKQSFRRHRRLKAERTEGALFVGRSIRGQLAHRRIWVLDPYHGASEPPTARRCSTERAADMDTRPISGKGRCGGRTVTDWVLCRRTQHGGSPQPWGHSVFPGSRFAVGETLMRCPTMPPGREGIEEGWGLNARGRV
jgi:hypothetical protein